MPDRARSGLAFGWGCALALHGAVLLGVVVLHRPMRDPVVPASVVLQVVLEPEPAAASAAAAEQSAPGPSADDSPGAEGPPSPASSPPDAMAPDPTPTVESASAPAAADPEADAPVPSVQASPAELAQAEPALPAREPPRPPVRPAPPRRMAQRAVHPRPEASAETVAPVMAFGAPLPAATPRPAAGGGGQEAALEAEIRAAVQAAVRYPAAARMMGLSGRARLLLDYRAGVVGGASLAQSAGAPLLDDAAMAAARSAHYPAAPPEVGDRSLRFLVWVEFRPG